MKKELPAGKGKPEQRTTKKVKYVGTQQFINKETGEVVEMEVTDIEERDFNFSKVWMRNFIATLDMVGNQKTRVAFWVIDHLNRENQLISTFREMSTEIGCSYQTVAVTMKVLQDADFLRKLHSGVYMVNPDIVFKGSRNQRLALCMDYHSAEYKKAEFSKDEKITMLKDSIAELRRQLSELEAEDAVDVEIEPQLSFDENGQLYQQTREKKKRGRHNTSKKEKGTKV